MDVKQSLPAAKPFSNPRHKPTLSTQIQKFVYDEKAQSQKVNQSVILAQNTGYSTTPNKMLNSSGVAASGSQSKRYKQQVMVGMASRVL